MPLYDYECERCGSRTEKLRPYEQRDEPFGCGPCYIATERDSKCPETGLKNAPAPQYRRVLSVPSPMPSSKDRPGRGRSE